MPSVQRALKSRGAQLALCQELAARSEQHRAVLEHDQFNLVITLMNCALQVGCPTELIFHILTLSFDAIKKSYAFRKEIWLLHEITSWLV